AGGGHDGRGLGPEPDAVGVPVPAPPAATTPTSTAGAPGFLPDPRLRPLGATILVPRPLGATILMTRRRLFLDPSALTGRLFLVALRMTTARRLFLVVPLPNDRRRLFLGDAFVALGDLTDRTGEPAY